MKSELVAVVYAFYSATIVINIVVAAMQYWTERGRAKKLVMIYWVSILMMSVANGAFREIGFPMALVAATGTVISQALLGSVLAEVVEVPIDMRPPLLQFLGTVAGAGVLARLGAPFVIYESVLVVGCVSPYPYVALRCLRSRKPPMTTVEKMFFGTALLMTLHYFDYPYFRPRPELYLVGSGIAFALFHILSILMPMMVVEHTLRQRNAQLEVEVQRRANQLTSAEERLWEAKKLASLGRMAGGVAHELNTPLSIIALHADHVRADAEHGRLTRERIFSHVSGIHQVIERISKITEVLRRLAREGAGVYRRIDLRLVLDERLAGYAAQTEEAGIAFTRHLETGPWPVLGDPTELSLLVAHLLDNAIDAVAHLEQKWIRVTGARRDAELELAVEDSGSIPAEVAARIMEPFFTTKPIGQGSGLGLSISKAIAESHGGTLFLDQASATTRLVLRLPVAAKE